MEETLNPDLREVANALERHVEGKKAVMEEADFQKRLGMESQQHREQFDAVVGDSTVITVVGKKSEYEITLDIRNLERSINVLLKLAPADLRSPESFLDDMYETKKKLKELLNEEQIAELAEIDPEEITVDPRGSKRPVPGGNPFEEPDVGTEALILGDSATPAQDATEPDQ